MTTWIDHETGEMVEGPCPFCAATTKAAEVQVSAMEAELRAKRAKITKLESAAERALVAKRDTTTWNTILAAWREAFPDRKTSATSVKSANATACFLRLESGAVLDDILCAIRGAKEYPFVVYGRRVRSGSKSDLAVSLRDIVSVNNDGNFDILRDVGAELRVSQ